MGSISVKIENRDIYSSDGVGISVVMTTYNGSRYLRSQIDSIILQLNAEDELLISDDRSSDKTLDILREYASDQVRIIETSGNLGPIRNFEYALAQAQGSVIVLSDQDDVWLEGRLTRVRNHFSENTMPYGLLVLDSDIVDGDLKPTLGSLFELLSAGPGLMKNILRNTYVGCHMAFRRQLLDVAMPFPRAIPMHDVWLGLVSESLGPVTFEPGATMLFRRSGENYTQSRYSTIQRVTWRIGLMTSLVQLRLSARFRERSAHATTGKAT
jgi:glycosyltransferase involved in cell wall biosynthesis